MEPMEDQLVQRSLREPGTAVLPPATTEGGVKTKVIDWVKHPHGHTDALDDGIAQRDEETEVEIIHHATVRDDGTYYRLFALDGTLYRVDDMVLVGCDDEDPALCRITSLWEDHQGHKMVELQQGDDDDERDEVEIEGLVSLAATKASGGQKEAAPPPVEEKAAGPTTAASKRSSFVHEGLPPDLITCTISSGGSLFPRHRRPARQSGTGAFVDGRSPPTTRVPRISRDFSRLGTDARR